MKKSVLWLLITLAFSYWTIFAQENIPDAAQIDIKDEIIEGEAANLTITMIKDESIMSSYTWTIFISISEENWQLLKQTEYTLPNLWKYEFHIEDMRSKTFEKWFEIRKEWNFYIEVSDLNDINDTILWTKLIHVNKNWWWAWNTHINILSPISNSILPKIEIIWQAAPLPNANVLIYIDDKIFAQTTTDSEWSINYIAQNISQWDHSLQLEIIDIEWKILWTSDKIFFTYISPEIQWYKDISIKPETWLMIWDLMEINVITDEMIESVRVRLSDKDNENIILNKIWNGLFSQKIFLTTSWIINISLDMTASNNTLSKSYDNVKQITVLDVPQISNVTINTDEEQQSAEISWNSSESIPSYLINYRLNIDDSILTGQELTNTRTFIFNKVPYNTPAYLNITPYRNNEPSKHGTASQTIQFIIKNPSDTDTKTETWIQEINTWNVSVTYTGDEEDISQKCTIQNISTHTEKIGDNHYLVRDKVENVSKYIVYSSESPQGTNKIKVYETSDTSYEYPFDYSSEEDQFMYFRIVWICDNWEEMELTWATKVQVWPAQDFFLLICVTLLIYFGIKLFRQTEE